MSPPTKAATGLIWELKGAMAICSRLPTHPVPDSLYDLLMKRASSLTSDTFLLLKKCTFMIAKLKYRVFKKKKSDYSKLTI